MTDGRNGGGRKPRPVREFTFAEIEQNWTLSASITGGPAVWRDKAGYSIRVVVGERRTGGSVTTTFDFFRLDLNGGVAQAPRGYAKDYKPGRITGMEEAVAKYARDPQEASP